MSPKEAQMEGDESLELPDISEIPAGETTGIICIKKLGALRPTNSNVQSDDVLSGRLALDQIIKVGSPIQLFDNGDKPFSKGDTVNQHSISDVQRIKRFTDGRYLIYTCNSLYIFDPSQNRRFS